MPKLILTRILMLTGIITGFAILLFLTLGIIIGKHVSTQCEDAKAKYNLDCVSSLIATLEDETNDYRTRNDAIWALGQLGNHAATPALESLYTGNIPDREPLDQTISQYELAKALTLTRGGVNGTAWVWRWRNSN